MRQTGEISEWNDDRGFGFITPRSGGGRLFVHIKSFADRRRRPVSGDAVTYESRADSRGRPQAAKVSFVNNPRRTPRPGPGAGAIAFALLFVAVLGAAAWLGYLPFVVAGSYIGLSAVTFVRYALDKSAANNDRWRTPENTLHLLGLLGGWPGALVAQGLLRHKSRKTSFRIAFWVTAVLNCAALGWLITSPIIPVLMTLDEKLWALIQHWTS